MKSTIKTAITKLYHKHIQMDFTHPSLIINPLDYPQNYTNKQVAN